MSYFIDDEFDDPDILTEKSLYTLQEAQEFLNDNLKKGLHCPCCGQFAKRYKRKITSSMVMALIFIYRKNVKTRDWIHVEDYLKNIEGIPSSIRGDSSKLRYWGLIEKKHGEKEDKNPDNGYYRMTEKGEMFVKGLIKIPKYVFIYNDNVECFDVTTEVEIRECFKNKFSYDELMKS